jgi:hypothetical protein
MQVEKIETFREDWMIGNFREYRDLSRGIGFANSALLRITQFDPSDRRSAPDQNS